MNTKKKCSFVKIKDSLIKFFKNPKEVISFFLPIVITICLIIPVPYYIEMGGGSISLNNKINIDSGYDFDGSLEALYVREGKGVVLTYLLSYVVPSFDREKINKVISDDETEQSYNFREKLYFTSSLDAATKVAFESAGKDVSVSSSRYVVIYKDKNSNSEIVSGDEILQIEDDKITSYKKMGEVLKNYKIGDVVKIKVKRDGKFVDTVSTLISINGEARLGIVMANEIKYDTNPKVSFKFNGKQAGPSGGLMIALTIYNKLVNYDITGGRKIVGTGTIDLDGNIGEIGGVKHKLMAANRKKADIVFVPKGNYKEALKYKKQNKYDFALVSVDKFADAIDYLKK